LKLKKTPFSIEAEQSIIATILIDELLIDVIKDKITAEMFYEPKHKKIFQILLDMRKNNQAIDLITIQEQLKSSNLYDEVGGSQYIIDLADSLPSTGMHEQYTKIIIDKFLLRRLIDDASLILKNAYDGNSFEMVIDEAEKSITSLVNQKNVDDIQS